MVRETVATEGRIAVEIRTYFIDSARFATLDEFYDEVERELLEGTPWGRNLDAFDDILRGCFGPLPREFALVWLNASLAGERLGHRETARQLRLRLQRCHASARSTVQRELALAEQGTGPTVFDWLVEIIRKHRNVRLELVS